MLGTISRSTCGDMACQQKSTEALAHVMVFAAGTCLTSPLGYQTNLMVMKDGGYTFADFARYGGLVQDLIIYALGIGSRDLRYVYEKDANFAAFPTFPVDFWLHYGEAALYYKGTSFDVLPFPSPILDAFPVPEVSGVKVWLDAGITIERFAELPKFHLGRWRSVIAAQGQRLYDVKDDSGKTYYRMVDVSYLVGAHDVEAFGTTLTVPVDVTKAVGSRAPRWRVEETMEAAENSGRLKTSVQAGVACVYRLSGDYNPLHLDPGYAKTAGYEHPIVHGKCTLGHAARMLLNTLAGGDHRRFRSLQLRYASPVIPGQTLVTEIWDLSSEELLAKNWKTT
eukprot:Skav212993  [mRNA]  locus=scaffold423:290559:297677:- [translate_table: standard]